MEQLIHKVSNYRYNAHIKSVYDGDGTFHVDMIIKYDIGMKIVNTIELSKEVRIYGIDTPEIKGSQRRAGIIVRDFVRELILGKDVIIETHKDKSGKYGRLLIDLYINDELLSDILLDKGYAKPYTGGTKDEWSIEEIDYIIFDKEE